MRDQTTMRTLFERIKDPGADQDWFLFAGSVVSIIHGTAFRILGDVNHADDVTQEVLLQIRHSIDSFKMPDKNPEVQEDFIRAWIIRITTNLAINFLREQSARRRREQTWGEMDERRRMVEPPSISSDEPNDTEQLTQVRKVLHALPAQQREPLLLRFFSNMSYDQIASALGCTEAAARKRVFRSIESIRANLQVTAGIAAPALLGLLERLSVQPTPTPSPLSTEFLRTLVASGPAKTSTWMGLTRMGWLIGGTVMTLTCGTGIVVLLQNPAEKTTSPSSAEQIAEKSATSASVTYFNPYSTWYTQGIYASDRVRPIFAAADSIPQLSPAWARALRTWDRPDLPASFSLETLFADGRLEVRPSASTPAIAVLPLLLLPDPPPTVFSIHFAIDCGNDSKAIATNYQFFLVEPTVQDPHQLAKKAFSRLPLPFRPAAALNQNLQRPRFESSTTFLHVGNNGSGQPVFECKSGLRDQPSYQIDWVAGRHLWLVAQSKHSFFISQVRYRLGSLPRVESP